MDTSLRNDEAYELNNKNIQSNSSSTCPKPLEILVHNVSHSDVVLCAHQNTFRPKSQNFQYARHIEQRGDGKTNPDFAQQIFMKSKFSCLMSHMEALLYFTKEAEVAGCLEPVLFPLSFGADTNSRTQIQKQPGEIETKGWHNTEDSLNSKNEIPQRVIAGFNLQESRSKLGQKPLQLGGWSEFHVRNDGRLIDANVPPNFIYIFFPLLALVIPKWRKAMAHPTNSKQILYLISGSGAPRNPDHQEKGNSTEGSAMILQVFVQTFFPEIEVFTLNSGSGVFRYRQNSAFISTVLKPHIEAHCEYLASEILDDWKDFFNLCLTVTDGTPARTSALIAGLRRFRPDYIHFWQPKSFWQSQRLRPSLLCWETFEQLEMQPAQRVCDTSRDVQRLVKEVIKFKRSFLKSFDHQGKDNKKEKVEESNFTDTEFGPEMMCARVYDDNSANYNESNVSKSEVNKINTKDTKYETELSSFWLRKTRSPVLAVLMIKKENQKEPIFHCGINLEVSMPTGSLCAERNCIGTALASDLTLRRRDLKMIAVLSLPKIPVVSSPIKKKRNRAKPQNHISSSRKNEINEDDNKIERTLNFTCRSQSPCIHQKKLGVNSNHNSCLNDDSPTSRRSRRRGDSYNKFLFEQGIEAPDTIADNGYPIRVASNPLNPCGACKEWLLKIAEVQPAFKVISFTNEMCSDVYIKAVQQ